MHFLTFGSLPKVDGEGRPLFAYGARIHDQCPRRGHFDAGQFVHNFDDAGARQGWCLYEVGCKGPQTFSPCPIFMWNEQTSWPIGAGHPCIGCTEPHFWDTMTPFYNRLPDVAGYGLERDTTASAQRSQAQRGGHRRARDAAAVAKARRRRELPVDPVTSRRERGAARPAAGGGVAWRTKVVVDPVTRIEGHLRIEVARRERDDHPERLGDGIGSSAASSW